MTGTNSAPVSRPLREDHLGASTFVEKGWHQIAHGDFAAAERSMETALRLAPSDDGARCLLAWAKMRQGGLAAAREILDEILARDPAHALTHATLGYVFMRTGRLRDAHEHMSAAAAQMRDLKATLYGCFYLGLLYAQQRDVREAERFFDRTLSLAPNFIEAYYELGRTYWACGQPEDAERVWRTGNTANRFSDWGKRCAEAIQLIRSGRIPPAYS